MKNTGYMTLIRYLFTPEDTCCEYSGQNEFGRSADRIKTIFWTIMPLLLSILISVLL
ncbi:MAG: hypothetical protein ABIK15_18150 [Pseudomonadota bacterium]